MKIYAFISQNLGIGLYVVALAEDGRGLTGHCSSDEYFAKQDIGVTTTRKHEIYAEACPEGFELEWVSDPSTHEGVQKALLANAKLEFERTKQACN